MPGIEKLLFVDTNIWLDFYRTRKSDAAVELLGHLESIKDKIIGTHVLEMEYKKNRQSAIVDGLKELQDPPRLATHGIFSQAAPARAIEKHLTEVRKKLKKLRARLNNALDDPSQHDPVFQSFQRIFRRNDGLVLRLDSDKKLKRVIREKATRRFFLGCPPRKVGDTSMGDAINWEWMVRCAEERQAELVILTRDQDFGPLIGNKMYLNDHLKQEFKERLSRKRNVLLYSTFSHALKHFAVKVSKATAKSEAVERAVSIANDRERVYERFKEATAHKRESDVTTLWDWLDKEFEDLTELGLEKMSDAQPAPRPPDPEK